MSQRVCVARSNGKCATEISIAIDIREVLVSSLSLYKDRSKSPVIDVCTWPFSGHFGSVKGMINQLMY